MVYIKHKLGIDCLQLLTQVLISFQTCCCWLSFIPLFMLPKSTFLFFSSTHASLFFQLRKVLFLCLIMYIHVVKSWGKTGQTMNKKRRDIWMSIVSSRHIYQHPLIYWNWPDMLGGLWHKMTSTPKSLLFSTLVWFIKSHSFMLFIQSMHHWGVVTTLCNHFQKNEFGRYTVCLRCSVQHSKYAIFYW